MNENRIDTAAIREQLLAAKAELQNRIDRIHAHARDPLEADSAEQAAQLGNVAVVAALEAEAAQELAAIDAAPGTGGLWVLRQLRRTDQPGPADSKARERGMSGLRGGTLTLSLDCPASHRDPRPAAPASGSPAAAR